MLNEVWWIYGNNDYRSWESKLIEIGEIMFSIIIPVYNSEKYLKRCINSILAQTFQNFELIAVDDGSSDSSPEILKAYSDSDSRIKVIRKNNQGVSSARNIGINSAKGDYIIFVDADDYIDKGLLQTLCTNLNGEDLVFYNFLDNGTKNHVKPLSNNFYSREEALMLISGNYSFRGFVWNKAFKRKVIVDNDIRFRDDVHMCEDLCFCVDFIEKISTFKIINDALYFYEHRGVSASANVFNDKRMSAINVYDYLLSKSIIKANKIIYIQYKHQYIRHCLSIWKMIKLDKSHYIYRNEIIKRIKKENFDFLIDNSFNIKYKLAYIMIKLVPMREGNKND